MFERPRAASGKRPTSVATHSVSSVKANVRMGRPFPAVPRNIPGAGALTPALQRDDDRRLALRGTEATGGVERAQPPQLEYPDRRNVLEIVHVAHGHVVDIDGDPGSASHLDRGGRHAVELFRPTPPALPKGLDRIVRRPAVRALDPYTHACVAQ